MFYILFLYSDQRRKLRLNATNLAAAANAITFASV